MITLKTKFDEKTGEIVIKRYKSKHTCTMEHLGALACLIQAIKEGEKGHGVSFTTDEIFELIKELEKENDFNE